MYRSADVKDIQFNIMPDPGNAEVVELDEMVCELGPRKLQFQEGVIMKILHQTVEKIV